VVESAGREFFGGKISSRANCGTSSLTPRRFSRVFGIPSIGEHERRNEQPAPHLSAACQQFMPPLGLRISAIFDLQPGVPVVLVNAELPLRHKSPQGPGHNFREKPCCSMC